MKRDHKQAEVIAMSHVPHELADEFPEHVEKMHDLTMENAHFQKLYEQYHEVNRAVHRYEMDVEPVGDMHLEAMRKKRMMLKDEIYSMLQTA